MTVDYSAMTELWGADQLIHIPFDRLGQEIQFSPDLLQPEGAFPADVPILFTANTPGSIQRFSIVEFQIGEQEPLRLIVLGSSPDDPGLLFCLDSATGVVALLDPNAPGVELVNSTFARFVEFLYRLTQFLRADRGAATRAPRARQLQAELQTLDPAAFAGPESWWSIAFSHLTRTN